MPASDVGTPLDVASTGEAEEEGCSGVDIVDPLSRRYGGSPGVSRPYASRAPYDVAAGSRERRGERVRRRVVEAVACPVVAAGGAGVGVAGGVLDVGEGRAGLEAEGDEPVAQRVGRE